MHHLSFARLSLVLLASAALVAARPASAQNLFVGANGYIEQFTHSGTDLGVFYRDSVGTHLGHTSGLTFDSSGNLLIISDTKFGIVKVSPTGTYLANIGAGTAYTSVATDALGNIYAANSLKSTVDKFSASGTSLGTYLDAGSGVTTPSGLAFDKGGNLYVSNSQPDPKSYGAYFNKITKYAPDGSALGVFTVPTPDRNMQSITFSSSGELFAGRFNDAGRNGVIGRFSATGADLGTFKVNYGVYDPIALAFDASNNLFVDDNGSILEYSPSGSVVGQGPGGQNVYMNLGISASGFAFAPSASPVPEAATTVSLGLLLAFGLGGLVISRRRRSAPSAGPAQCVSVTRL